MSINGRGSRLKNFQRRQRQLHSQGTEQVYVTISRLDVKKIGTNAKKDNSVEIYADG